MSDNIAPPTPLDGIQVLEIGTMVTAPLAAMMLGDLGASVLKVEHPEGGDPFRRFRSGLYSPNFTAYNRNKRSITLNLRLEEGRVILTKLIKRADVLIENFRPSVMRRFGFEPSQIRQINPRLIHCSITGFGPSGPYSRRPAFDTVGLALSGMASLFVDPVDPHVTGPTIADNVTGMYACSGVMAALLERQRTGLGRRVEVNMLESSIALIPDPFANFTQAHIRSGKFTRVAASQSFVFRCGDDKLIALHLSFPEKFWQGLLASIGQPEIGQDSRFSTREARVKNYEELKKTLAAVMATRPRDHWIARFEEHDLPFAPVHALPEVIEDAHVQHLGTFADMDHPIEGRVVGIRCPIALDGKRSALIPPPVLGEHTEEVLAEIGFSDDQVASLRASSAI